MINETFFGGLKVASVQWSLQSAMSETTTRGGAVIRTGIGAALWTGRATLAPAYHRDAAAVEALLAELTQPGRSILAHDPRYNGPRLDPTGAILGASAPIVHALNADNRRLRVNGLPSGYVLSVGDYIGWQYGSNPVRYALHRVTSAATASGAGLTPLFSVTPNIRPGVTIGAAVAFVQPICKCLISARYGIGVPLVTQGAEITLIQTLR